jgi:hypothetical protein
LFTFGAVQLLQRKAWGYVLAGAVIVYMTIESAAITVDQWLGHLADPASTVASMDVVPVVGVFTALGLGAAAVFSRGQRVRS